MLAVDIVDIERFRRSLSRTPKLMEYLFHHSEQAFPIKTLSASFALKECLVKVGLIRSPLNFKQFFLVHNKDGKPFVGSNGFDCQLMSDDVTFSISHSHNLTICVLGLNRPPCW